MAALARMEDDVLDVLRRATIDGNVVKLDGQLDRKLYERTDTVLRAMGGRWDRRVGGHVFMSDIYARFKIEQAIADGEYVDPRLNGYFPTPPALVERVIRHAEIGPYTSVLEPSAGQGALADAARDEGGHVHCFELLPENRSVLHRKGHYVIGNDFLAEPIGTHPVYQRVVMNPPFGSGADVVHVSHAWQMVKPGGILVAIMSAGIKTGQRAAQVKLREEIDLNGFLEDNAPDAFASVGTRVTTVTVVMRKDN